MSGDFDTEFIGSSLNTYLWTLTLDETKLVISCLWEYFTSLTVDKRLSAVFLEDVIIGIKDAEEEMEEYWERAQSGEDPFVEHDKEVAEIATKTEEQEEPIEDDEYDKYNEDDGQVWEPDHRAQGEVVDSLMFVFVNHNAEEYHIVLEDLAAIVNVPGEQRDRIRKWRALHLICKWFKDLLNSKCDRTKVDLNLET